MVSLYITSKSNKPKTTSLNEIRKQINSFISTLVQISRQILLPHTPTHIVKLYCVYGAHTQNPKIIQETFIPLLCKKIHTYLRRSLVWNKSLIFSSHHLSWDYIILFRQIISRGFHL